MHEVRSEEQAMAFDQFEERFVAALAVDPPLGGKLQIQRNS